MRVESETVVLPLGMDCLAVVYLVKASPELSGKLHLSSWSDQRWIFFPPVGPKSVNQRDFFFLVKEIHLEPISRRPIWGSTRLGEYFENKIKIQK